MEKNTFYTIDANEYVGMKTDPIDDINSNEEEDFYGEIEGLRNHYDTVYEAVEHAVKRMGFQYPTNDHIEIYGEDSYSPHITLDFLVTRELKEATPQDIEEWKAGNKTLYQLEWELYINKFTYQPIDITELETAYN